MMCNNRSCSSFPRLLSWQDSWVLITMPVLILNHNGECIAIAFRLDDMLIKQWQSFISNCTTSLTTGWIISLLSLQGVLHGSVAADIGCPAFLEWSRHWHIVSSLGGVSDHTCWAKHLPVKLNESSLRWMLETTLRANTQRTTTQGLWGGKE